MEEFSEGHKGVMEPPNTRNPPERYPRPLYSRDSTQEDHTIPHHHQSGNLRDSKVEVKEEIKEEDDDDEDGVMEESEFLNKHKNLYQDTTWSHPATETHQRYVPILCIPGIPHRIITPSLTIIRVETFEMIILMLKKSIKRRMRSME
ncbi:uncharacterized protein LOC143989874 isoform X2 [Lithobates pipiens]